MPERTTREGEHAHRNGCRLVGRVIATSSRYAVGQIMLNKEFRASAKVQRGRVDGIVMWEGGEKVSLRNVAKTLDVKPGDVVITSEYSSIYPPGIKIGVVTATSQEPGALFQNVDIIPPWILIVSKKSSSSPTFRIPAG